MSKPRRNYEKSLIPDIKTPKRHYDQALVPEHLTRLTVEKIPLDTPFYIYPGERDDALPTAIFVAPDRRLLMSKGYAIDYDDANVASPIGRVGISRVALLDAESMRPRQVFIADLRFIEDHQLVDSVEVMEEVTDQEEFMLATAAIENSVAFDAFIALDQGDEIDEKVPKGTFYGDPELYPYLKKLRKQNNKAMRRYGAVITQAAAKAQQTATQPNTDDKAEAVAEKQPDQKPADQDVHVDA